MKCAVPRGLIKSLKFLLLSEIFRRPKRLLLKLKGYSNDLKGNKILSLSFQPLLLLTVKLKCLKHLLWNCQANNWKIILKNLKRQITWGRFHQHFTFQKSKKTVRSTVFLAHLRSGVHFIKVLQAAFAHANPKSAKKTDNLTVFFCAFGICRHKSCLLNIGEIDPKIPK